MSFTYNEQGIVDGYECAHGYDPEACGVMTHPTVPDLCARVAEHMMNWYSRLPQQSHVRLGKREYMRVGDVPLGKEEFAPGRPNLQRLAGL